MGHATDDADSAYRRVACRHPWSSVVAFYNTDIGEVRYLLMDGHNFGLAAAVLSWNRHSICAAELARRVFGVVNCPYFDDHDTCEPAYAGRSGKHALRLIYDWMGVPLSVGEKDVDFAHSNPFLGVVSDLAGFAVRREVCMRSKPERVARIVCDAESFLARGEFPHGEASSFIGKVEYTTMSASSHRVGRAALSALRAYHTARSDGLREALWPGVVAALEFFISVLVLLPPRRFALCKRRRLPIVLYTDAMYRRRRDGVEVSVIGLVWYDPELVGPVHSGWKHASSEVPPELLAAWGDKETKITQAEAVAPVVAVLSDPDAFRDREVVHYIDNSGALFGLGKGASRDVPTARLVHVFHALAAALGMLVWFSYVPSKANVADLPSRLEFALLKEMGSQEVRELRWPPATESWLDAVRSAFKDFAPAKRRQEKKWRSEIVEAIEVERRRRAERKRKLGDC